MRKRNKLSKGIGGRSAKERGADPELSTPIIESRFPEETGQAQSEALVNCLNPLCQKLIKPHKCINVAKQLYCSVPCYHFFSPKKIKVVEQWFSTTPRQEMYPRFSSIIYYIDSQYFLLSQRAEALDVSKSAYRCWDTELQRDIKNGLLDGLCRPDFYTYAANIMGRFQTV